MGKDTLKGTVDRCAITGCNKPVHNHGLCEEHYQQYQLGAKISIKYNGTCKVNGCNCEIKSRDLCPKHYFRYHYMNKAGIAPETDEDKEIMGIGNGGVR